MRNVQITAGRPLRSALPARRYALPILAALTLLFLAAARPIAVQPTSTYTSLDGHFSFTYPSNWTLHVNEVSVAGTDVFHPVQNVVELDAPGKPRPYILIEYMYNVDGQNIADFIDN